MMGVPLALRWAMTDEPLRPVSSGLLTREGWV